jgi:hypothetical protein
MRDSLIFYRSFYEAIKELPKETQAEVYTAIFEYSLNFNEVQLSGLAKTIFTLIKPQLEANNKRFINGSKAKIKQDKSETEAKPKQKESKTEANNNNNVNDNENNNEKEEEQEVKGFKKPTIENCIELFKTKTAYNWTEQYAIKSANIFYNFYESKNWMVGKNKMKSLNAAIGGWIARDEKAELLKISKTKEEENAEKLRYFKEQGF